MIRQLSKSDRFELINLLINKYGKNHIKHLCDCAQVSKSGYYNHFNSIVYFKRLNKHLQDEADFRLIKKAYDFKNRPKGAKQIKMTLNSFFNTVFNLKKIRRLMKKFGLFCPVRRKNPYRQIAKATKEHSTAKNILNRQFNSKAPNEFLLTDITYLFVNGRKFYLSVIKDCCTHEILAHHLSSSIDLSLATITIDKLINSDHVLHHNVHIHSDQGFHYTSPVFRLLLKHNNIAQSMSRKGNCWDNSPMESFFGHFKDESNFKDCSSFSQLSCEIDDYIFYYNYFRPQWGLKKMTPVQYRNHLLHS